MLGGSIIRGDWPGVTATGAGVAWESFAFNVPRYSFTGISFCPWIVREVLWMAVVIKIVARDWNVFPRFWERLPVIPGRGASSAYGEGRAQGSGQIGIQK
eukprot:gene14949-biopygen609